MAINQLDEEAIFNVARRIETQDARNSYLQQVCGADRTLLKRVTALLRAHDDETNFLEQPAVKVTATFDVPPVSTQVGTTIGPYKLLEQIGEGGMGVVYMAEQQQPVRRMVALKVIKPGTDTKEVIARFDVERQALALMDHPNIARILDAGTTETGRPYFVMDMVRGIPITT
jgi:serine/threonine protein kinase